MSSPQTGPARMVANRQTAMTATLRCLCYAACELFREIAETGLDHTTDTFRQLTGRDPISLGQFIRDNVALFSA